MQVHLPGHVATSAWQLIQPRPCCSNQLSLSQAAGSPQHMAATVPPHSKPRPAIKGRYLKSSAGWMQKATSQVWPLRTRLALLHQLYAGLRQTSRLMGVLWMRVKAFWRSLAASKLPKERHCLLDLCLH